MEQLSNQEKWTPLKGWLVFIIGVLLLLFVGGTIQYLWGMVGLALTQIMFLGYSLLVVKLKKGSIKEVFPIKKISVRDFFGVVFMWVGAFVGALVLSTFSMFIFPEMGLQVSTSLNDTFTSTPAIVTFFIVAIMPAICEEAVCRGVVLSHFRGCKNPWTIILTIGVMFGIFHLDPIRFLNTALLGGVLAYLMVKKNNFLLPMLLHFLNNTVSVISTFMPQSEAATNAATDSVAKMAEMSASELRMVYLQQLGIFLIIATIVPICFLIGTRLLRKKGKHHPSDPKKAAIAAVLSIVFFLSGIGITIGSVMQNPEFQKTYASMVAEQSESNS